MELAIIVAAAENHVIGRDNGLIWHLSADLKRFKALTTGHAILMGRKTFESMGRALPNRRNVVKTAIPVFVAPGAEVEPDIPKALELLKGEERVFVIGGGSIYREFWDKGSQLYLTEYGNRYHNSLICSRLKRTVYAIHVSKAVVKGACTKCSK